MGPALANIDALVQMPYGCGEQNMINFVPNIVVLGYLKATKQAGAQIEAKAKKYMEAGYQRELTYRFRLLSLLPVFSSLSLAPKKTYCVAINNYGICRLY